MKVTLEYRDATSQKFWEGEVDGKTLVVRFGKIGTSGQTQTQQLASEAAAEAELRKKAAAKTKKGYAEVASGGATPAAKPAANKEAVASAAKPAAAPKPAKTAGPAVVPPPYKTLPIKELKGDEIRLSDHPDVFALSADGTTLAAHGISSVHIVDVASRTWTKSHKSAESKAMAFLGDGLIVGSKTMHLIDPVAGKKRVSFKGHKAPANQIVLSADGATLWSGGGDFMNTHDRFLCAFDTQTGELRYKAKPGKGAGAMSMAVVDDVVAVAAEDGHIRTFSAADGKPLDDVELAPSQAYGTPFGGVAATDGNFVASFQDGKKCAVVWLDTSLNIQAKVTIPLEGDVNSVHHPMVGAGHIVIPLSCPNDIVAVVDEATRELTAIHAPVELDDCRKCIYQNGLFAWRVREGVAIAQLVGAPSKAPSKKKAEPTSAVAVDASSAPVVRGAMAAGGPTRNGVYEGNLKKSPKVVWARAAYHGGGDEHGGWVVVGDGIAVGSHSGWLAAFDEKTGDTRWEVETSKSRCWANSGISIAHGSVFMATNQGLYAFDAANGKEQWKARVADASGAPLVFDDVVIIGGKGGLHARSLAKSGRKAWVFEVKDRIRTPVAYAGGLVYAYADTQLLAIDLVGQKLAWSVPAAEPFWTGPVLAGDYVVYISGSATLAAADRRTGKQVWTRSVDALVGFRFISASDDAVFLRDDKGRIQSYALSTGKPRWKSNGKRKKPYSIGSAGPAIVGDTVVAITVEESTMPDTYLTGFDAKSGDVLWDLDNKPVYKAIEKEQKKEGSGFDGQFTWYGQLHVSNGVLFAQTNAGIVAFR